MRLNGVILEGAALISFCDNWRRSYIALPVRSSTPPPVSSSSSTSISTDPGPSSLAVLSAWSAITNDSGVSLSNNPSTPPFDPWTVNAEDIQDIIAAQAEKLQDPGEPPM